MDAENLKDHVKDRWPRLYRTAHALRRKPGEIAQRLLEANYSLFRLAKRTTAFRAERNRTEAVVGYRPGLHSPTTINEKILWKKLLNRNPLLPVTADKLTVREFVRDRLEPETAGELVVPVLETAGAPEDLSLGRHDLPVVLKANHGSGLNLFIHNRRADGSFIAAEEHAPHCRPSIRTVRLLPGRLLRNERRPAIQRDYALSLQRPTRAIATGFRPNHGATLDAGPVKWVRLNRHADPCSPSRPRPSAARPPAGYAGLVRCVAHHQDVRARGCPSTAAPVDP